MVRPSKKSGPVQRLRALFLAFLLLSGLGVDAYALDPCSHHNPGMHSGDTGTQPVSPNSPASADQDAHAGHQPGADMHAAAAHGSGTLHGADSAHGNESAHSDDSAHGADPAHGDPSANAGGSPHGDACTCMAECAAAAAIPVPHAPAMPEGAAHDVAPPAITPSPDATASLHLDLLPYGIAPPAAPSSSQV